jgi:hypothetical protein
MAIYCYAVGENSDGKCICGRPATMEIQSGWHNANRPGEQSGGVYDEMCEECYSREQSALAERNPRRY